MSSLVKIAKIAPSASIVYQFLVFFLPKWIDPILLISDPTLQYEQSVNSFLITPLRFFLFYPSLTSHNSGLKYPAWKTVTFSESPGHQLSDGMDWKNFPIWEKSVCACIVLVHYGPFPMGLDPALILTLRPNKIFLQNGIFCNKQRLLVANSQF